MAFSDKRWRPTDGRLTLQRTITMTPTDPGLLIAVLCHERLPQMRLGTLDESARKKFVENLMSLGRGISYAITFDSRNFDNQLSSGEA